MNLVVRRDELVPFLTADPPVARQLGTFCPNHAQTAKWLMIPDTQIEAACSAGRRYLSVEGLRREAGKTRMAMDSYAEHSKDIANRIQNNNEDTQPNKQQSMCNTYDKSAKNCNNKHSAS